MTLTYDKNKYPGIYKLARIIKRILKSDRDCVITVSGTEGEGKSTLIIHLLSTLDKRFTLERNVIFMPTETEIRNTLYGLRKYSGISVDEAMKVMYKRNWMTKENKSLNTLFSVCRKRNIATFLAIPNFWDLDNYFREHRTRIWIFVPVRGEAMIFLKDMNPIAQDPWHRKQNIKVSNKFSKRGIISDVKTLMTMLTKTKNYKFSFNFPDLTPDVKEEYNRLSNLSHGKLNEENVEDLSGRQKLYLLRIENAMRYLAMNSGTGPKEMAEIFGVPDKKYWVEQTMKRLKIRPVDLRLKRQQAMSEAAKKFEDTKFSAEVEKQKKVKKEDFEEEELNSSKKSNEQGDLIIKQVFG